eukprot:gene184-68_t
METKQRGGRTAARELQGAFNFLCDIFPRVKFARLIRGDNVAANLLGSAQASLRRVRHLSLAHLYVRELAGDVPIEYVSTLANRGDVFTKVLGQQKVQPHLSRLGLFDDFVSVSGLSRAVVCPEECFADLRSRSVSGGVFIVCLGSGGALCLVSDAPLVSKEEAVRRAQFELTAAKAQSQLTEAQRLRAEAERLEALSRDAGLTARQVSASGSHPYVDSGLNLPGAPPSVVPPVLHSSPSQVEYPRLPAPANVSPVSQYVPPTFAAPSQVSASPDPTPLRKDVI